MINVCLGNRKTLSLSGNTVFYILNKFGYLVKVLSCVFFKEFSLNTLAPLNTLSIIETLNLLPENWLCGGINPPPHPVLIGLSAEIFERNFFHKIFWLILYFMHDEGNMNMNLTSKDHHRVFGEHPWLHHGPHHW